MRTAEGLQAQFLLTPDYCGHCDASIATARSTTWADLWRTVLWLELRLLLAGATLAVTVWLALLVTVTQLRSFFAMRRRNGGMDCWHRC